MTGREKEKKRPVGCKDLLSFLYKGPQISLLTSVTVGSLLPLRSVYTVSKVTGDEEEEDL